MAKLQVFYATVEGHTERIAARICERAQTLGVESARSALVRGARDAECEPPECGPPGEGTIVVVAAPIYASKYPAELVSFLAASQSWLTDRITAFVTVSLSAASVRDKDHRAVEAIMAEFLERRDWAPTRRLSIAGCLAYTRYGFFKKRLMRWLAKRSGGATDMSRDHVYTDWSAVEALVDGLVQEQTNPSGAAP